MKTKLIVALVAVLAFVPVASADTISLSTPGVVGLNDLNSFNDNASDSVRLAYAQQILNLSANFKTDLSADPGIQYPGNTSDIVGYQTGPVDYSALLTIGVKKDGVNIVDPGWDYVLAKYDGQNAGYVLFYIPTYGTTLPAKAAFADWNKPDGDGYGLSGWITFNRTTVPDGGSMVMLFGMALMGLAGVRRMLK